MTLVSDFRVTLIALTAGNPLKAWRDGQEPDDVWEDQEYPFDDLDAAKDFIRSVTGDSTTHVKLFAGDELIYDQDAAAYELPDAAPGVVMAHTVDFGGPVDDSVVPDGPKPLPSQRSEK